jgi:hypothetical protein
MNYSRKTALSLSGTTKGVSEMGSIVPFLPDGMGLRDSVFEPHQIKAMSAAFDEVCQALKPRTTVPPSKPWRPKCWRSFFGIDEGALEEPPLRSATPAPQDVLSRRRR